MKTCPTCGNQYDDEMKFCQVDGTPLNEPPKQFDDPYKTMIGNRHEQPNKRTENFDPNETIISGGSQTMPGTPFDGFNLPNNNVPPPFGSNSDYAPPSMNPPSLGDMSGGSFNNPHSSSPGYGMPQTPDFKSGQTRGFDEPRATSGFDANPQGNFQPQWTPPPSPNAGWENQPLNQNSPFSPPQFEGASGTNNTLPIVSLACGIVGLLTSCCFLGLPLGIAAFITGFIARKNVRLNPKLYTGDAIALVGMILGAVSVLLTFFFIIANIKNR